MAERSRIRSRIRRVLLLAGAVAALIVVYLVAAPLLRIGGVGAASARGPTTVRLDQGWSGEDSLRFHHTSQGTRILPLSWFMALEQPVLTPLPVGRLADRDYLSRFGFLSESPRPGRYPSAVAGEPAAYDSVEASAILHDQKEYDLPVGFAIEPEFRAPYADPPYAQPTPMVGLTCAACHTGRLDILRDDGTTRSVLIDGGSSMIHITQFQEAVKRSLFYTRRIEPRFQRFARRVLGDGVSNDDPRVVKLRKTVDRFIELGLASDDYAKEHKLNGTESGYSRTDALGLIGNRVFGVLDEENQVVTDAPVNFPHLWDTPWFDWVQYNGSIRTPMARNIGEALGVGAIVNLTDNRYPLYESTVNVGNLHWMEDTLGGDEPFKGLQPPRWDDMAFRALGEKAGQKSPYFINTEMAEQGEVLYKSLCIRCHLPPRATLLEIADRSESPYFTAPDPVSEKHFLALKVVDLSVIGTDPNQALNFYRRIAVSPEPTTSYGPPAGDESLARTDADADADAEATDYGDTPYSYRSRWVKRGTPGAPPFATISAEEGLFRVTSMIRRLQYSSNQYQLLVPDVVLQRLEQGHGDDILSRGQGLVVVATVGETLHCRVFDVDGTRVIDRSEADVEAPPDRLAALKETLAKFEAGPLRNHDVAERIYGEVAALLFPDKANYTNAADRSKARRRWDRYRTIPEAIDLGEERAIIARQGEDWVIAANLGYRARPHDGIWATPPYLHNGSVPNLYEMLLPASRRSERFYLGSTRFDPVHVGYETAQFSGAFEMDTTQPGNSNQGHEFRNLTLEELETAPWDGRSTRDQRWAAVLGVDADRYATMPQAERWVRIKQKTKERLERPGSRPITGVLGPEFSDEQRWQLVEYLKTR